jgi:hypothetical protein
VSTAGVVVVVDRGRALSMRPRVDARASESHCNTHALMPLKRSESLVTRTKALDTRLNP